MNSKLTKSDDNEPQREAKRRSVRPSKVFVVIHDKEPPDAGSDYRRGPVFISIPARQNTLIVGLYYDYADAARAAGQYVQGEFDVRYWEKYIDDDEEDVFEAPLTRISWMHEGWRRQEICYDECSDRVHIQEHSVG